jgi:OOP family OmpA-OmpF porin
MRSKLTGALFAALWAGAAGAVSADKFEMPYFSGAGEYLLTDSQRAADNGLGYQLTLGVPLENPRNAVELRFISAGYTRHVDGMDNYQSGLFVDYVRDFGAIGDDASFLSSLKPFASLGAGSLQEDVLNERTQHLGLSLGGGVFMPFNARGWGLRLDARLQGQSSLLDYVVNLGLQVPMTLFYDKPVLLPAGDDCPVAVVDSESGRRDCKADSDQDGVADTADQCPGTPPGIAVDANGCARPANDGDADKDGVPDSRDQCPGTPSGLKVNEKGCVVAQKSALRGVTFLPDGARLTDEGRATLDAVAETLKAQADLKVEIAGHTDSVGSEAYNTLLSQQRADAVRAYLVGKGVEGNRMTAVGYGELEPVARNDTEEGRRANRRVEFRISTE